LSLYADKDVKVAVAELDVVTCRKKLELGKLPKVKFFE